MENATQPLSIVLQTAYENLAPIFLKAEEEKTALKKQNETLLEQNSFLEKENEMLKIMFQQERQGKEEALNQNQVLQSENEDLKKTIQDQQQKFRETEALQQKISVMKWFLDSQLLYALEYKRRISSESEKFDRKMALLLSEWEQKDPQTFLQSKSLSSSTSEQRKTRKWKKNLAFSCIGAGCYFMEQNLVASALVGIAFLMGWAIYKLKKIP